MSRLLTERAESCVGNFAPRNSLATSADCKSKLPTMMDYGHGERMFIFHLLVVTVIVWLAEEQKLD